MTRLENKCKLLAMSLITQKVAYRRKIWREKKPDMPLFPSVSTPEGRRQYKVLN